MDRRHILTLLSALALPMAAAEVLAETVAAGSTGHPARFLTAFRDAQGDYALAVIDGTGTILFQIPLAGRGHGSAVAPDRGSAVVFARRPGRFAVVVDLAGGWVRQVIHARQDRHFYGHGFFSPDGRLLYATENDFDGERGVLGIYAVDREFQRIGEIDCGGIGCHEVVLMSDGVTVAVAIGGIATHPDYPRQKLNLDSMDPALVYLDRRDGRILNRARLPGSHAKLSLRHLTEAAGGRIWICGQYEGAAGDRVSLVGHHRAGNAITPLTMESDLFIEMKHYVGAIAASADGRKVAATSPRGGLVAIWDSRGDETTPRLLETRAIADVCGVAPTEGADFLLSDGQGGLRGTRTSEHTVPDIAWDNHLRAI